MSGAVEVFHTLEALPPDCESLFAAGARHSFHLGRLWFRTVLAEAMPADAQPLFLLYRTSNGPGVLLPLRTRAGGARLEALSTPYSCLYQPLTAPAATAGELFAAGQAFGRFCRGWAQLRLDALDAGWPGLPPLLAGAREAGLVALRFDHFGNWHEPVAGRPWADYLAARPGALRETIRRRLGQAERDSRVTLEMIGAAGAALAAGIVAYEDVYARSLEAERTVPPLQRGADARRRRRGRVAAGPAAAGRPAGRRPGTGWSPAAPPRCSSWRMTRRRGRARPAPC